MGIKLHSSVQLSSFGRNFYDFLNIKIDMFYLMIFYTKYNYVDKENYDPFHEILNQ